MMRLLIFNLLLWTGPALAVDTGIKMQISADEVEIYAQPSFSSSVIDRLKRGTAVKRSDTKTVGQGGLGVFYKGKIPTGRIGYVTDSEIEPASTVEP